MAPSNISCSPHACLESFFVFLFSEDFSASPISQFSTLSLSPCDTLSQFRSNSQKSNFLPQISRKQKIFPSHFLLFLSSVSKRHQRNNLNCKFFLTRSKWGAKLSFSIYFPPCVVFVSFFQINFANLRREKKLLWHQKRFISGFLCFSWCGELPDVKWGADGQENFEIWRSGSFFHFLRPRRHSKSFLLTLTETEKEA